MGASSTRLKKPLHIWLARLVGFGIVLVCLGATIVSLPERLDIIRYRGMVEDIRWQQDESGYAVIYFASSEAIKMGVRVGDKFLNPEVYTWGAIGSPVTLALQTGNEPARLVALSRRPWDARALGGSFLGLSANISITLAMLIVIVPLLFAAVSSLLLCSLKSDDWMALLTAVAIVYTIDVPGDNLFSTLFYITWAPLLFLWLILFPNGKRLPRWAWLAILLLELPGILFRLSLYFGWGSLASSSNLELLENVTLILRAIASLTMVGIVAYRYKFVLTPFERQQSKWVMLPVLIGAIPMVTVDLLDPYYWNINQFDKSFIFYFLSGVLRAFFSVMLMIGILLSVFQYRLYDVDVFVSRAIVYSALTGVLGLVGVLLTPLIDYVLKQTFGDQTGLLAVMISALPIAALFNPVRERLQRIVDQRFKQEEFDFENSFIEFNSELSALFTVKELSTLLSRHAVEQLDVKYASVFLNGQNGHLKHVKTASVDGKIPEPILNENTVERIKSGQLASPEGDYSQSLVVPLVVPRSRKPSVLGALLLGPRLQGVGYSTAMVKSLKKFGEEVGKVFYAAQLRSRKKRLASNQ